MWWIKAAGKSGGRWSAADSRADHQQKQENARGIGLRERRSAAGREKTKLVEGCQEYRPGGVPAGQFGIANDRLRRRGQRRRMQRLADVADRLWPTLVLMEETPAGGEIQKSEADGGRRGPAEKTNRESSPAAHTSGLFQLTRLPPA